MTSRVKLSIRFLALLLPVLAAVVIGFNALMDRMEGQWTVIDLAKRSQFLFDAIQDPILESVTRGNLKSLHRVYQRFGTDEKIEGLLVCSKDNRIISRTGSLSGKFKCGWTPKDEPTQETLKEHSDSGVVEIDSFKVYRSIFPLVEVMEVPRPSDARATGEGGIFTRTARKGEYKGYVLLLHRVPEGNPRSDLIRRYTLYTFLGLAFLISLITLIVYRWSLSRPAEQLTEALKGVLTGDMQKISSLLENSEFAPLARDLDQVLVEMREKSGQGEDEEENGKYWGPKKLNKKVQELFPESRVCVLANEQPYIHERKGAVVEVRRPASGLVASIEPVIKACSGLWIGHSTGSADQERSDKNGMLMVPEDNPLYALKRIWLSREEDEGFYYGFSSKGLWPLCHIAHERPQFRLDDWQQYVHVNTKFAEAFQSEVKSTRPVALIQDYHFSVLPAMIRKMRPDAIVSLTWHIPWPGSETIRICPWRKDLLLGMLGADLLNFQLPIHVTQFLDSVDRFLEARVSRENSSVTIQGHTCVVKAIPTSIEFKSRKAEDFSEIRKKVAEELSIRPEVKIGVGIDRLDYTKGILERLEAFEAFLARYPDQVGKVVFIQISAPTRMHIQRYQELSSAIQQVVDRINWKFYGTGYQPVILRMFHHSKEDIERFYRAADFCFVNPLHDGMNLVAKEFVVSRSDQKGVLVLSSFTGSSRELKDAILVNPYDIEECVAALKRAVDMPLEEVRERMNRMREVVLENNVYAWGAHHFTELHTLAQRKLTPSERS